MNYMNDLQTVFDFRIWYDCDNMQHRYVIADAEENALTKLELHRAKLVKAGFAWFEIDPQPTVEIDYVIN